VRWMVRLVALVALVAPVRPAAAATITAASCQSGAVQAAINQAASGDTVLIPNGLCTWTSSVSISGKGIILRGSSTGAVVITNQVTTTNMITVTEHPSARTEIAFLTLNLNTSHWAIRVSAGGRAALIHDIAFRNGHGIQMMTNRGVIYRNTYTLSKAVWQFVMCAPLFTDPTSWTRPHTMGTADTTGDSNLYIEDNTFFQAMSQSLDISDNCRVVVRHNTFEDSGVTSHGPDTGTVGLRHFELYDNTFIFHNRGDCDGSLTVPVPYYLFLRGGTGVFTTNTLAALSSCAWGNHPPLHFTVMAPWRNAGSYPCWNKGYPVPQQIGRDYVAGSGQVLGPVYIWNNSGAGNTTPGFKAYPNECGATGAAQNINTYLQMGRDVVMGPRPGYAKYPYPHPLRSGAPPVTPVPEAPTVIQIARAWMNGLAAWFRPES
jgi:hypothetical protein